MGTIKWIFGVLGWAYAGPIGALIGFLGGKLLESSVSVFSSAPSDDGQSTGRTRPTTYNGDFGVCLLILSAAVMKSDKEVKKSELNYVKEVFKNQFGQERAAQYILMFKELLKKDFNLQEVCTQIRNSMDHASRLQLVHYLFSLAQSDGEIAACEIDTILCISRWMAISTADYESIKAMFIKNTESAYQILEISPEATEDEIKKAYKKMAMKYHPDRVSHLGEEVQKQANEKFKEVNNAYETIKKERGFN